MASTTAVVAASAAAEVIDPFELKPATYEYAPTIGEIQLEIDQPGDFAGVTLFAGDSRFTTPLWALSVIIDGALLSVGDLLIEFTSHPTFQQDNESIRQKVQDAFKVPPNGGSAMMSTLELFTASYVVNEDVLYAEGVIAGIQRVPEPTTLTLLGLGIFMIGVTRKRKHLLRYMQKGGATL